MTPPSWNDAGPGAGTMVRAALWLVQVVGEGNTFTKEQLRAAFPGVSQIDRRVRDLREYGWVILTSAQDATLMAEDQRFLTAGVPVWDPAARRGNAPHKALSAKELKAVHERDHFMCSQCGISGGEAYPDDSNQTAVLAVTRRAAVLPDGREEVLLVTECKRCRAGSDRTPVRADDVVAGIKTLEPADRRRLARWIERERRSPTRLDQVWAAYRRLPADARDEVRSALDI